MILKPRKGFSFIVKFIDFFNPVIVLLSIAGLILEYTQYKEYVLYPNRIIDMVFVVDFLLRLISFPSGRYFFKSYGWVDFLASIPGFTAFMQFGQYFGLFKVMRIGRFFKIIRVLRFLRIFSFLKKMKGDSAFIQERIMKIGVTIVIIFVTGLGFTDYFITQTLSSLKGENIRTVMELSRNKVDKLAERVENVAYYSDRGILYDSEGKTADTYSDYAEKLNSLNIWYTEVRFSDSSADHDGYLIPVEGILVTSEDIMVKHDNIMLILIASLIMILVILIFYIGYIFAKDMKIVQLINDSVDAGDYWLLKEEARKYSSTGELAVEEGEDEIVSLIKMAAVLAERAEVSAGGMAGMDSIFSDTGFSGDFPQLDTSFQSMPPDNEHDMPAIDSGTGEVEVEMPVISDVDEDEEINELAEVLSDFGGFTDEFGKASISENSTETYAESENSLMSSGSETMPYSADTSDSETVTEKLMTIEKTVREINSKLSSLENVRESTLESVARDAASRAVKITSKSIGEYIHKKLSGK